MYRRVTLGTDLLLSAECRRQGTSAPFCWCMKVACHKVVGEGLTAAVLGGGRVMAVAWVGVIPLIANCYVATSGSGRSLGPLCWPSVDAGTQ